jgi:hypothetical protein
MRDKNSLLVAGLVAFVLVFPFGYLVHLSARFPGSIAGTILGMMAAVLILLSLAYLPIKYVPALRDRVTRRLSMSTLLAIHIYTGVLGPLLALIHSAHKFNSPIGLALVIVILITVLSGYIGRYLLGQIAKALRGREAELAKFRLALGSARDQQIARPSADLGWFGRLFFTKDDAATQVGPEEVALALADAEYAVRSERVVHQAFRNSMLVHLAFALALLALLIVHIFAAVYFGLRWL